MTLNYDKKFIFNILKSQIENRAILAPPNLNPHELAANLFWESVCGDGVMHLNKAKYPASIWTDMLQYAKFKNLDIYKDYFRIMDEEYALVYHWYAWPNIYTDSIMIHHLFDDDYNEKNCEVVESFGLEGPYCYENVIVEKGDVVIDAGAFIGDWSAVAAQMGGIVYAFEPSPDDYARIQLHQTALLNDFKVVEFGLGDMVCMKMLNTTIMPGEQMTNDSKGTPCYLTTVDAFSEENNLNINFIKSDIEGYERYMIKGATRVLKEDQPKLAIRTYHMFEGNDYEYLPQLIKEINPNYNIIMRKKTLYAYVE